MSNIITEYASDYKSFEENENLQFLYDGTNDGKEIEWHTKKKSNLELSESYKRLGLKKAKRVSECGTKLSFRRFLLTGIRKLFAANFCKDRLCPTCAWRRSLKIFGQASLVMKEAQRQGYDFIFLTLTVKNCQAEDLQDTISHLMKSFDKLFKRRNVRTAVKGWFRALEITHNTNRFSKSYDTYHPHYHLILCVNRTYFKHKDYIKQSEWQEMWKSCLKADYDPIVDVRKFKANNNKELYKSLAETAKYTVKDVDYIIKNKKTEKVDVVATDRAVATLDKALRNRRLTAYGGVLKEIHKALNLEDAEESGDLIHTDLDDETLADGAYIIEHYEFNVGYGQYVLVSEEIPE